MIDSVRSGEGFFPAYLSWTKWEDNQWSSYHTGNERGHLVQLTNRFCLVDHFQKDPWPIDTDVFGHDQSSVGVDLFHETWLLFGQHCPGQDLWCCCSGGSLRVRAVDGLCRRCVVPTTASCRSSVAQHATQCHDASRFWHKPLGPSPLCSWCARDLGVPGPARERSWKDAIFVWIWLSRAWNIQTSAVFQTSHFEATKKSKPFVKVFGKQLSKLSFEFSHWWSPLSASVLEHWGVSCHSKQFGRSTSLYKVVSLLERANTATLKARRWTWGHEGRGSLDLDGQTSFWGVFDSWKGSNLNCEWKAYTTNIWNLSVETPPNMACHVRKHYQGIWRGSEVLWWATTSKNAEGLSRWLLMTHGIEEAMLGFSKYSHWQAQLLQS